MATLQSRLSTLITALGTDYKALVAADKVVPPNVQGGTTYTFVLTDAGQAVEFTSNSAIALTIPANASVAFPIGTVIEIAQMGNGVITVGGDVGVTFNSRSGYYKTNGTYAMAYLRKRQLNGWLLTGDLTL